MSVAADVAEFVKTKIESLGITHSGSPVAVKRRKGGSYPEGGGALPQIVVSVGEEGTSDYMDFEGAEGVSYPVAVTVITATGSKEGDNDTVRDWVQQIRRLVGLATTWAGFAGFLDVSRAGKVPFDRSALSKDFNTYQQVFTVRVAE